MSISFKDLIDLAYHTPETQATVTVGAGTAYFLTLNQIIGALTVILLLAQLGLAGLKYWDRYKAKKNGTKE